MKKLIAAAAAVALLSTSTVAAAAGSNVAHRAAPAPAGERVESDSALGSRIGLMVPLIALVAIGGAIYLLFIHGKDDEEPVSP